MLTGQSTCIRRSCNVREAVTPPNCQHGPRSGRGGTAVGRQDLDPGCRAGAVSLRKAFPHGAVGVGPPPL